MEVPVAELLMLLTSITVVPAIIVVLYAFVTGQLTADEDRRFLPVAEPEIDWWDTSRGEPGAETPEEEAGRERA